MFHRTACKVASFGTFVSRTVPYTAVPFFPTIFRLFNEPMKKCKSVNLLFFFLHVHVAQIANECNYEGCSNMNASSFITFVTYMLRQNVIPFWKELFVAFKMAPNIKKHSHFFSSYRPLYKGCSSILKFFSSKMQHTFWYM